MPRGKAAPEGATYTSQNGYHYTKRNGRFVATHILRVQDHIGRELLPTERVRFKDGDKSNLNLDNLQITVKGEASLKTQRARLVARIEELQAQLAEVDRQIELKESKARLKELQAEAAS